MDEKKLVRKMPPVFPMGFRVGVGEDVCIVDFVDASSKEDQQIFYSIALTREQAKDLLGGLTEFVQKK